MDNSIKLMITEDAAEFDRENLEKFQNFNISISFCSKDGEELARLPLTADKTINKRERKGFFSFLKKD